MSNIRLPVILFLASVCGNAFSGEELKVIGELVPAACTPTFTTGNTVDYGKINSSTLSVDVTTPLTPKTVDYSIACSSATKIGLRLIDNRPTSVLQRDDSQSTVPIVIADILYRFGLGLDDTRPIGFYVIINDGETTIDGVSADMILNLHPTAALDPEKWWQSHQSGLAFTNALPTIYSYTYVDNPTPKAGRVFSGKFKIRTFIAPAKKLNLSHVIPLDGLATMELSYL